MHPSVASLGPYQQLSVFSVERFGPSCNHLGAAIRGERQPGSLKYNGLSR